MIVDSSAIVAIVTGESEREALNRALSSGMRASISASTLLEASIVLLARLPNAPAFTEVDQLIQSASIDIQPTTHSDAIAAREAFRIYGKGRGHPAQLNFGDCFTYALARRLGRPILCKGNDFALTDAAIVPLT